MSQGPITTGNVPAALKPVTVTKPIFTKPTPPKTQPNTPAKATGGYHGQKRGK